MRFTHARLKNVGTHADLKVEFGARLNGIVGANGSGKSTLVESLRFALTGDFTFDGVKDSNISSFAAAGATALVEIGATTGSIDFTLSRNLRGAVSELAVDGKVVASKETNVNTALGEILGMPPALLASHAFVAQEDFFGFLKLSPVDRSVYFQRLLGLTKSAKIHQFLSDELGRTPVAAKSELLDQVRVDLAVMRAEKKCAAAAVADATALRSRSSKADREIVVSYLALKAAKVEFDAAKVASVAAAAAAENTAAASRDAAQSQVAAQRAVVAASRIRGAWQQWDDYLKRRDAHNAKVEKLILPVEPTAPTIPDGYEPVTRDTQAFRDELKADYEVDKKLVDKFAKTGYADCPTCGTSADTIAVRVAEAEVRLPKRKKRYADANAKLEAAREYETHLAIYRRNMTTYAADFTRHDKEEAELTSAIEVLRASKPEKPSGPEITAAACNALSGAEKTALAAAATSHARAELAEKDSKAKKRARQAAHEAREAARLAMDAYDRGGDYKAIYLEAKARREQAKQSAKTIAGLEGQLLAVRRSFQLLKEKRVKLQADDAALEPARRRRVILEGARLIHHAKGAPRIMLAAGLQQVIDATNVQLAAGNQPFTVQINNALSFFATFDDRRGTIAAMRLSGAQKMILALAIRCGINAKFVGGTGFLALDEPTSGLDDENVRNLTPALDSFRAATMQNGLQCIVVTHKEQLVPLFDNVVIL